ncbi:MAG TPA: PQQ-binding-like beta-propeller repeat protein [Thermoanaerobaculia bacterium]|nr:PQQ-binding-like beta-propeller repeat protein [Thermoanaerobaculia bacterium]
MKLASPSFLLAATALSFAVACGALEGDLPASDSPMFRGGPTHPGVYAATGAPQLGGIRWVVRTQGPIRSTPAVAGGRIYFGSSDGNVYAVDLQGHPLWVANTGAAVTSSPAVADGRVFLQNRKGLVLALSAADGKVLWRAQTGADVPLDWGHESGDMFISSPVVADGTVLVGSGDGHLYALEAGSGHGKWRVETGGRIRSSPAVADGVVYVGSLDGSVYAADLATGAVKWRFDTQGRSLNSASFGYDRKSIQSSPAVADGKVYIGARDGSLYAIDAATGKQKWRVDHGGSWVITAPAVWDGKVFVGSSDLRFLQAVDARISQEIWRVPMPASVWSSPSIAGSTLYVGDTGGGVHALDAKNGKTLWTFMTEGGIFGAPVPIDGAVLVTSGDGNLYCLAAGDGPVRRAVFWDEGLEKSSWVRSSKRVRDYLEAYGQEVVAAPALVDLMEKAVGDKSAARTVITFAMDFVPPKLVSPSPGQGLLRRFLDAGGTVVWLGMPPLIWPRDPQTGGPRSYTEVNRKEAGDLLGVDFGAANFDPYGTRPTPAGRAWGLKDWWMSMWSVAPADGLEVLAFDENGQAAAWVKSYGGEPGTGFVMLGYGTGAIDPAVVRVVADYRPGRSQG